MNKKIFFILLLIYFLISTILSSKEDSNFKLGLEVSQSFFYPSNSLFKSIYNFTYPTYLGFNLRKKDKIGFSIGIRFFRKYGRTINEPSSSFVYSNKLLMNAFSIPFIVSYYTGISKYKPYFFGGLNYNIYKEKWLELPNENTRRNFGYEVGAGILAYLHKKFYLSISFSYYSVKFNDSSKFESVILRGFLPSLNCFFSF